MSNEVMDPKANLQFCEDTIKMVVQVNIGYVVVAKRLAEIAERRLYAPRWESFDEFTMECIKESKGKVNTLMNIYRKFVVQGEIAEDEVGSVGWTILGKALPLIHDKKDAEYWLEQAQEQTPSNFNRMIKEHKTGKDMTKCQHDDTYMLRVCNTCKDKWEVHDITTFAEMNLYEAMEEAGIDCTFNDAKEVFKKLAEKAYEAGEPVHDSD